MHFHSVLMRYLIFFLSIILIPSLSFSQSKFTISGYVREQGSSELLLGVNIYQPENKSGTTTNNYGFYSLTLPATDTVLLVFSYVGYKTEVRKILLNQNVELNIDLIPDVMLNEVEVVAGRYEKISEVPQMSVIEVPISQIKNIPALLGEKDVLKVLQLMPGVQSGSEGNSGLYVRGGGPDQNLIILDDAVVYNAYHLFGFFSLFNGDALKSVELTKGGFPARFGGRLSSVVEMNMKDGNKEEIHGEGGIGLISSRLMLEGPLKKNKSSFLISGRRTYADLLARPFMEKDAKGGYYFYDLNAKINYDFGRKDKVYLSGYFGQDRFFVKENYDDDIRFKAGFDWGNATGTLRWNHLFNNQVFSNTSLIFSQYRFNINVKEESEDHEYNLNYFSGIRDLTFKYDIDYLPNPQHTVKAGIVSTFHRFSPSAVVLRDTELNEYKKEVDHIDVVESGIYVEDIYRPFTKLRINGGFRLSHFQTKNNSYIRPEPRITTSYQLRDDFSVKASYARMNQYVHLLSNTGVGLPTDLWVPSTEKIAPQESQQMAIGVAKDIMNRDLTLSVEAYYKKSKNIIGYKEGASFLLIEDPESADKITWEDNVTPGQGWSYGLEFLLQRKIGKFSGWVGYTLSWTQLQFDSLNFGQKFYARYDRRHDISLVGIYKPGPKITLSGTWVYGTGNAITLPQAEFRTNPHTTMQNNHWWHATATDYGPKNGFRMASYHRFDVGIQFHKKKKWGERTWEISVYNAYNRMNPFFYFLGSENDNFGGETVLKQVTLFPIIPSVTYSFKF